MPKGKTYRVKQARDAGNGEWVSLAYAKAHPGKTVVETVVKHKKSTK